ncbi:gephyrin-like molybdotransferase Glp [Oscillatoria sp. FACHB-1406]|uniref:molybdopterin molybdotransferase MoeA n=1 Tax=Oscillatoria sp. FACHB-1406 TaxID=2692846 RepID=UPI001683AA16|nr:gephyrin-like molybdotransferase Glp [Oscillatoria sp. FACHB-1406]MBD2576842.1 molybdopterin molybdotransferase MoeA [Oscillatoria sp. FACHB-1406]
MISSQEAEAKILQLVSALDREIDVETVDLTAAPGRILATDVTSSLDFPHWDNSAMDGYAVRYADVQSCPVTLDIIEEIPAGVQPQKRVEMAQAARIFTGAILPEGADTIVMQEQTRREENRVTILQAPQCQEFVRHRASFYQAGETLLEAGIAIAAPEIAVLAAAQCTQLTVYRRPRVAILSTGDELVSPEKTLQPGQIVDSNQYALAAFVAQNGGIPLQLGIVRDRPDELKDAIANAIASADFVLSTGGVSVGDYDYIDRILQELGGAIHIQSVAIKPGKPLTVATFARKDKSCLYFGIPGNPVSALVTAWRFVLPALKKLSGLATNWSPELIKVRTQFELKGAMQRETYLWGKVQLIDGYYRFVVAGGSHSSSNLINLAQTNALAIVPLGVKQIAAGTEIWAMRV